MAKRSAKELWEKVRSCFLGGPPPDNPDDGDSAEISDGNLWSLYQRPHIRGRFSFAAVSANVNMEDFSQVHTDPEFTFVGIYDGHGGQEASLNISRNIFNHFYKIYTSNGNTVTADVLRETIREAEESFKQKVDKARDVKPLLKVCGSCCLVGVFHGGSLSIANLGDSRAVIGYAAENQIYPLRLTRDDNVNTLEVREELQNRYPDDDNAVIHTDGSWRVKGIIQVTKSIGDFYMKLEEYQLDPRDPEQRKYVLPEPVNLPYLSSDPTISRVPLGADNRFVVFASDGLWDIMSEEEVCNIVHRHNDPHKGAAEVLIQTALINIAQKNNTTYEQLKRFRPGQRRAIHDDITVVVIYLDNSTPRDPSIHHVNVRAYDPFPGGELPVGGLGIKFPERTSRSHATGEGSSGAGTSISHAAGEGEGSSGSGRSISHAAGEGSVGTAGRGGLNVGGGGLNVDRPSSNVSSPSSPSSLFSIFKKKGRRGSPSPGR